MLELNEGPHLQTRSACNAGNHQSIAHFHRYNISLEQWRAFHAAHDYGKFANVENFLNVRNPQSAIRNPQSAIRNPQSIIR